MQIGEDHTDTCSDTMPRRYYTTRLEAEQVRRRGERIFLEAERGYYLVRPKKRDSRLSLIL